MMSLLVVENAKCYFMLYAQALKMKFAPSLFSSSGKQLNEILSGIAIRV